MSSADKDLTADELFKAAYPELGGWVRRQVDDDDIAHEIAAEAFVRLLARWTKVETPHTYLYTIAAHLIRGHERKTERGHRKSKTPWTRRAAIIRTTGRHRMAARPQPVTAVGPRQR